MTTTQMTPEQRRRVMQPVIPEIAKAFQNDPRTQLAQQALQNGSVSTPVAQGGYAWGDGIARVLDGVLGGYMQKKQMQQYGEDEQALLDLRKQRGLDGMGQAPAATPPSAPPPAPLAQAAPEAPQGGSLPPEVAQQAAAMLAPQGPPQGAPQPAPSGAVDPLRFAPPPAPVDPSMQGGPQRGMRPFAGTPATKPVQFVDPLAGMGKPTSGYGPRKAPVPGASTFHKGQDYAAPAGTPVRSAADGVVIRAWQDTKSGGGNSVLVRHPDGSVTGYAHLADYVVKRGDTVRAGQPIGAVGSTGRSSGNHLHLTYRDPSGRKVNPVAALKFGEIPETKDPNTITVNAGAPANAGIEDVPDAPSAVVRPNSPEAEAATQSRTLQGAYRIMADANRYESQQGQELYTQGLSEQTRADEAAAERRQRLKEMGYQTDLGDWANSRSTDRQAGWQERRDAQQANRDIRNREDTQRYGTSERIGAQEFQASEAEKNRAHQTALQTQAEAFGREQLGEQIQARRDLAEQKRLERRTGLMSTPTGLKIYNEAAGVLSATGQGVAQLEEFERIMQSQKTGGFILGNAPGLTSWTNSDIQTLESISNSIIKASAGELKGALSDKDVDFLRKTAPSIRNTGRANRQIISQMKSILQRAGDFQRGKIRAMEDGNGVEFLDNWNAYQRSVRPGGMSFEEWQASRPKFGPDGRRL